MNLVYLDSHDLNFSNRLVRTRMPGGVAGAWLTAAPYADQFASLRKKLRPLSWGYRVLWDECPEERVCPCGAFDPRDFLFKPIGVDKRPHE